MTFCALSSLPLLSARNIYLGFICSRNDVFRAHSNYTEEIHFNKERFLTAFS